MISFWNFLRNKFKRMCIFLKKTLKKNWKNKRKCSSNLRQTLHPASPGKAHVLQVIFSVLRRSYVPGENATKLDVIAGETGGRRATIFGRCVWAMYFVFPLNCGQFVDKAEGLAKDFCGFVYDIGGYCLYVC